MNPEEGQAPSPVAQQFQADRAGLLADVLENWGEEKAPAAPAEAKEAESSDELAPPEGEGEALDPEEGEEGDTVEEEAPAEEKPEEDAEEAEPEPEAKEPEDPDLEKRLERIQARERAKFEAISKARDSLQAEYDQKHAQLKPYIEKGQRWEELEKRGKYDPASILMAFGWTEDALEIASKSIFTRSKTGQADPRLREQAARELRDIESEDKFTKLQRETQELRESIQTREHQQRAEAYIADVVTRIGDDTPIVKAMVAKNPARARAKLLEVALSLAEKGGRPPEPAKVAAELEKIRIQEYEEDGHDVARFKSSPKSKTPAAGKQATAATKTETKTKPKAREKTREEIRAEILNELPV